MGRGRPVCVPDRRDGVSGLWSMSRAVSMTADRPCVGVVGVGVGGVEMGGGGG